jgi:hypothetical protein
MRLSTSRVFSDTGSRENRISFRTSILLTLFLIVYYCRNEPFMRREAAGMPRGYRGPQHGGKPAGAGEQFGGAVGHAAFSSLGA